MTRKHIHLLFVCWLAYAAVPVINHIGLFNGVFVMLCVTKGVMIHHPPQAPDSAHLHHSDPHAHHQINAHANHQVNAHASHVMNQHAHHMGLDDTESQTQTADDHEAEGCPCIHFFFDTKFHLEPNSALVKASQPIIDSIQASPTSTVYAAKARGPPVVHFMHNPFTTFT